MRLSDKVSVQQLVITAVALGLKNVVISPGSRNAPLSISFNQHPGVRCTSIRDERSAGFFALGKAIELKEPVAIICTSGSAAINFAPALVEAYHLRVPLIVFTADRPVAWVGQGDGQTINQRDLYSNYIRKSYELDGDTRSEEKLWYNNRCLNEGFFIAMQKDPGPVHFNIPLSEPLYHSAEAENFIPRIFAPALAEKNILEEEMEHLQNVFAQTQKVMILAGQQWPDEILNSLLIKIAAQENTIVLSESTSNIHHPHFYLAAIK